MTEEQAQTKWCPFVRLTASQGEWHTSRDPSLPSAPTDTLAYRCIASACMAWRWGRERNPEWRPTHQMMVGYEAHPDDQQKAYARSTTDGYCGLAGQPS